MSLVSRDGRVRPGDVAARARPQPGSGITRTAFLAARRADGAREHRRDVDGLRAVAVLLVVAFHAGAVAGLGVVPGGYVGVDVFYVISGFLITGLLADELRRDGRVSLPRFYARRARRLLPAATVVLVAVAVMTALVVAPLDRAAVGSDVRAAALWYANWHFAADSTQYMADTAQSPVLHYWSLSVEEQFYVVWPLLLLLVAGRGLARRSWRVARNRLVLALGGLFVGSLAASLVLTPTTGPWAYYGLHTRAWELAAGGLLALARPVLPRAGARVAAGAGAVGLVLVVGSALAYDRSTPFPGSAAVVPVLGTVLLLAAGARGGAPGGPVSRALSVGPAAYVGRVSYAWYLWHWPALVLVDLLARRGVASDDPTEVSAPLVGVLGAVAGSFALAALSTALLEQPVRRSRWLSRRVPLTLAGGAALAALSVGTAAALLPPLQASDELAVSGPGPGSVAPRQITPVPEGSVPTDDPPVPAATRLAMTPEQARADFGPRRGDCFPGYTGSSVPADCRYGDRRGRTVVALVGDSHAGHWLPALDRAAKARGWQLYFWAKTGCPIADVTVQKTRQPGPYVDCTEWRTGVMRRLAALPRLDLVVVSRSRGYPGLLLQSDGAPVPSGQAGAVWKAGVERTLTALRRDAREVVLFRDTPWAGVDVPSCLSANLDRFLACEFEAAGGVRTDLGLFRAERAAVGDAPDVHTVDPTPWVCPGTPCRAVWSDGTVVYRDGHHLTATFAATLAGPLGATLARHLR